jgi:hypothetical protein
LYATTSRATDVTETPAAIGASRSTSRVVVVYKAAALATAAGA